MSVDLTSQYRVLLRGRFRCLVSRITGHLSSSTHFSGYGVDQELSHIFRQTLTQLLEFRRGC
jgi:hypothetical protein